MTEQKHDHIKWFSIGFLSALGVVALAIVVLCYSLTPLVKVDETTGRVKLLGGLIDLQARDVITQLSKEGSFVIGTIEGVEKVPPEITLINIKFGSGQVRVDYNESDEMNWDCDGAGKDAQVNTLPEEKKVNLDFSSAFVDCDVSVPVRHVRIEGSNGQIEVRKIQADLDVKLTMGELYLDPILDKNYEFDLKVADGNVDDSLTSEDEVNKPRVHREKTIKVHAEMKSGSIERLD